MGVAETTLKPFGDAFFYTKNKKKKKKKKRKEKEIGVILVIQNMYMGQF
jgi:hypothetical protein